MVAVTSRGATSTVSGSAPSSNSSFRATWSFGAQSAWAFHAILKCGRSALAAASVARCNVISANAHPRQDGATRWRLSLRPKRSTSGELFIGLLALRARLSDKTQANATTTREGDASRVPFRAPAQYASHPLMGYRLRRNRHQWL